MNIYDILFNFSSGEVLKLKIKDIENLLSLFESLEKENYKYIDDEGVTYIIDLNKVEYISYISNEKIEDEGQALDSELIKFL